MSNGAAEAQATQELAYADMHLHLDWISDPLAFSRALTFNQMAALGCTVTPGGYAELLIKIQGQGSARAALGLHPWYLGRPDEAGGTGKPFSSKVACEQVDQFVSYAEETRFIGEIGLDFGSAHANTADTQVPAFATLLWFVKPGSVISLHAVQSAHDVLDLLEQSGRIDDCACVFHWFSGTSEELARARRAGCYFSVGPFMLKSKRGREYARQIDIEHLLLETDLPIGRESLLTALELKEQLASACVTIAQLKGIDAQELAQKIASTSSKLLLG